MKSQKPRGPVPSLIGGTNGRPKKQLVKGKSTCKRCKCELLKGIVCIEIPQVGKGFSSPKRFCSDCFQEILEKTRLDMEELQRLTNAE